MQKKVFLIDDSKEYIEDFKNRLEYWNSNYEMDFYCKFEAVSIDRISLIAKEIIINVNEMRENCEAIFLDLGLNHNDDNPARFGFRLGQVLREEFYEVPLIVLTQFGKQDQMLEGYRYDFDGFVMKQDFANFDYQQFLGCIAQAQSKRNALVENLEKYYSRHIKRLDQKPKYILSHAFSSHFVSETSNLEATLDSVVELQKYFSQTKKRTVILFADLVDSTAIKQEQGFFEGLIMTRTHNQIVTEEISLAGGTVVKFIGDCVMARFDYMDEKEIDSTAVNCAIRIQEKLSTINRKTRKKKPILSRIGISVGPVADFYGNDPQGSCVDLAARLQGKCKIGGVLVSKECIDLGGGAQITSKTGEAKEFNTTDYLGSVQKKEIKGIEDLVETYQINWLAE